MFPKICREGSWWISSESDPRWNAQGNGLVGGLECPPGAKQAIKRIQEQLGEEPPEDLEYGYMKD